MLYLKTECRYLISIPAFFGTYHLDYYIVMFNIKYERMQMKLLMLVKTSRENKKFLSLWGVPVTVSSLRDTHWGSPGNVTSASRKPIHMNPLLVCRNCNLQSLHRPSTSLTMNLYDKIIGIKVV